MRGKINWIHFYFMVILILVLAGVAIAEEGGHMKYHDQFYQGLKQANGASCCNNRDCRPAEAYIETESKTSLMIAGRWIDVPKKKVQKMVTPDGASHWCGFNETARVPVTYCAILPWGGV